MKSGFADFHKLRKYLLGEITDTSELESIEKKMLSDGLFLAEIERVEAELIEEYLNEMLDPGEKKNFEKYFLAAPERKEKFRFMLALEEIAAQRAAEKVKAAERSGRREKYRAASPGGLFASGVFRFVSLSVLILCSGAGLWWYFAGGNSQLGEGLAELRTAYLKQRSTEVRLSALDYAPPVNTRGGGSDEIDITALDHAGLLLMAAVKNNASADSYRALGLYYASKRDFNSSLAQFEKGAAFNPAGAAFYADHGAVLLETSKSSPGESNEKRFRYRENSLSQLDQALKIDAGFLPALFNRALCLQEMRSDAAAREAWKAYLEKDPSSEWAKEAQVHLKQLDEKDTGAKLPPQVMNDFLQAYDSGDQARAWKIAGESKEMITGTMISEQLTRGFLSAAATGAPSDAERMLSALNFLGRLEKENAGDNFFSELADYYNQTSPDERAKLNRAQALAVEAYALWAGSKYHNALQKFTESREIFAEAGDHLEAAKTDYWISYCQAEDEKPNESLKLSLALADHSRARSYKWLLAQALTLSGSTYTRQSNFSPAIRSNEEALQIAREISDAYSRQKISAQLADLYSQLNEPAAALQHSQNSLSENGAYFNSPRQTWRNYMFASQVSYKFGFGESAIAYAQEAVLLSRNKVKDPAAVHNSFLFLSSVYKATENYGAALDAAEESARAGLELEEGPLQNRLLADSLLQKAEAERLLKNYPKALESYDRAISLYLDGGERERTIKNYHARKGRLLCYEKLGQDQNVEEELPRVLAMAEYLRAKVEKEDAKTAFFAKEQGIYEFAAVHALKKNNTEFAFNYIEKEKARSLLDDLRRAGASPATSSMNVLTLPEVRQQLPAGSQLVQYAVLPDKLLIWVVTDSTVSYAESKIPSRDLDGRVRQFMEYASHAGADRKTLWEMEADLYAALLKPIEPFLDKEKAVIIIPDKVLCYLPFEVLRPPAGKYAVEEYQISYAPSGTLFVMLSQTAAKRSGGEETFLGVGNPAFDRAENPNLRDLPAAEREIHASAAFYRISPTFIGREAVKKNILDALPRTDVFHFAGHFKVNDLSPQFSKFLLAGTAPSVENDLTAAEISDLKLDRTRLVVLSACQTAIENYYHGEGAIGVARTFFAAGAPVVVATRWEVDTDAAAGLMTAFHRNRKEKGLSAAAALRAAQIELLKNESFDLPYYWAAFAVVGGLEKP